MTDLIADKVITLDVGGHHFVTSLATLTKYPDTYFSGLFSGKYTLLKNGDAIFIDRDGTHFRLVLNFLRSGKIQMPTDTQERNELMLEAEFYCLREAIEASIVRERKAITHLSPTMLNCLPSPNVGGRPTPSSLGTRI